MAKLKSNCCEDPSDAESFTRAVLRQRGSKVGYRSQFCSVWYIVLAEHGTTRRTVTLLNNVESSAARCTAVVLNARRRLRALVALTALVIGSRGWQALQLAPLVRILDGRVDICHHCFSRSTPASLQQAIVDITRFHNTLLTREVMGLVVQPSSLCGGHALSC